MTTTTINLRYLSRVGAARNPNHPLHAVLQEVERRHRRLRELWWTVAAVAVAATLAMWLTLGGAL